MSTLKDRMQSGGLGIPVKGTGKRLVESIKGYWYNPDYLHELGGTKKNPLKLKSTNKWNRQ